MSVSRRELENFCNRLLNIYEYKDYGPNGLQIEGTSEISKIAFSVSATRESAQLAIQNNCQALIVHHGLFWQFHGVRTITGAFAKRIRPLIENEVNLFGYHLPLDAHPEVGNAKTICDLIGLQDLEAFGDYKGMPTGLKGKFDSPVKVKELRNVIEQKLNHSVIDSSEDDEYEVSSMGIITGGANGEWKQAQRQGLDAYLTGEMSEHDWHESKEGGVVMFAAGHHSTEKFGIQALQKRIEQEFEVETIFFDSENPA